MSLLIRASIPYTRLQPHDLPAPHPPPNTITLEIKLSTHKFRGADTNIQTIKPFNSLYKGRSWNSDEELAAGPQKPWQRAAGGSLGNLAHSLSHAPSPSGAAWVLTLFLSACQLPSFFSVAQLSVMAEEDPADLSFTCLELKRPVESDWPLSILLFENKMVSGPV